jgi:hypothetical protein
MTAFFSWCRADHVEAAQPLSRSSPSFDLPDPHAGIVKVKVLPDDGDDPVIEAHILPSAWPLFAASKQVEAASTQVHFHRLGRPHVGRCNETLRLLRAGKKVVWLGPPGIGKSAGMNYVLAELLRHMGDEGWPPLVALRVEGELTLFSLADDGSLKVDVKPISISNLNDLFVWSEYIKARDGVLVLELSEVEFGIQLYCPVVFSTVSSEADTHFRGLDKAGLIWLLDDPWSVREVQSAALCMFAMGDLLDPAAVTVEDTLSLVSQRYGEVGGLPRIVLGSHHMFAMWCYMKDSVTSGLFNTFHDNTRQNTTDSAQYFMSLAISPDVDVPSLFCQTRWKFFTPKHALAIDQLCCEPKHARILQTYGLEHQIHEAKAALLPLPPSSSAVFAINNHQRTKYHLFEDCAYLRDKTVLTCSSQAVSKQKQCQKCASRHSEESSIRNPMA